MLLRHCRSHAGAVSAVKLKGGGQFDISDPRAWRSLPKALHKRPVCTAEAQPDTKRGFGEAAKQIARRVQGALPIVGLLSRLAAPSGGIGSDEIAYPEFARALLDRAPEEFNAAAAAWEKRYGRVGQRRYVLLYLWMARTGLGLVSSKSIASSALRTRVTHDIGIEMERFENNRDAAFQVYAGMQRPRGKTRQQVDIAVDALCRLSVGIKDGEPIPAEDAALLVPIVSAAFEDVEGAGDLVRLSVTDEARKQREMANAL